MNDISAVQGLLARLRESLQRKQQELDGLVSRSEADHNRSIQFISKLIQACRGHDHELDNRLAKLRLKLNGQLPLSSLDADLVAIELLLQQHGSALEESIGLTRSAIELGARQLKSIKGFPPETRESLRAFLASPEGDSIGDHQKQVVRLLEFYRQAIHLLRQPTTAPEMSAPRVPESMSSFDTSAHTRIADELQRLITELDFSGPVGERLADIRRQLLEGISPPLLAETCLQVIALIIEGTREERKTSQAFLGGLNESLTSAHLGFAESLDEGRALQQSTRLNNQAFDQAFRAIEQNLAEHDTLHELKGAIGDHLSTIKTLQQEKTSMASREQHLLTRLATMEARLRLMKEETAEYKKRLTIQKHKLFLDSLTQVHNRAALDERLEIEHKRWLRYHTPLCLAIIDIDHFKHINDTYGHMAGDKALQVVAKALQNSLRDTDFIARFGGEEFVVLLPNINPDKFQKPLETLRQTIKNIPFRFRENRVEITVSIGATLLRDGDSTADAFERADRALYDAKHSGRDRTHLN